MLRLFILSVLRIFIIILWFGYAVGPRKRNPFNWSSRSQRSRELRNYFHVSVSPAYLDENKTVEFQSLKGQSMLVNDDKRNDFCTCRNGSSYCLGSLVDPLLLKFSAKTASSNYKVDKIKRNRWINKKRFTWRKRSLFAALTNKRETLLDLGEIDIIEKNEDPAPFESHTRTKRKESSVQAAVRNDFSESMGDLNCNKEIDDFKLAKARAASHISPAIFPLVNLKAKSVRNKRNTRSKTKSRHKKRKAFHEKHNIHKNIAPKLFEKSPSKSKEDLKLTKARIKRDQDLESIHGFRNEMEELKYYQDIREPESDEAGWVQQDEKLDSESIRVDSALNSMQEVKDLAKQLVAKVNDLQNYLNIGKESRLKNKKNINVRAIDTLCANISAECSVLEGSPEAFQRCIASRESGFASTPKLKKKIHKHFKKMKDRLLGKKRYTGKKSKEKLGNKRKFRDIRKAQVEWGRWTDWSSCSVTCGKGRQIRWRYCLKECKVAETEMEEKACQLPACPPGKFLGIF